MKTHHSPAFGNPRLINHEPFYGPPDNPGPSKSELRAILADAVRNTAAMPVPPESESSQPRRRGRGSQ